MSKLENQKNNTASSATRNFEKGDLFDFKF